MKTFIVRWGAHFSALASAGLLQWCLRPIQLCAAGSSERSAPPGGERIERGTWRGTPQGLVY